MATKTRRTLFIILLMVIVLSLGVVGIVQSESNVFAETNENYPNLDFTLINSGTEYKVGAANKTITEAVIPASYNGLPVTEVADNGFMSCTQLEKVVVPSSVKKIGNNAFMRCTNLSQVKGMGGVASLGTAAFSMCSNLDYLILPSGITSAGSGVFRNVNCNVYSRMDEDKLISLNSGLLTGYTGNIYYGQHLVFQPLNGDEGLRLVEYQNLDYTEETLVIPSWIGEDNDGNVVNQKVIEISAFALDGCNADEIIIAHPNGSFNHSINICAYAFSYTDVKNISIEVDVTLNDDDYGTSEGLFYESSVQTVTLPDTISELPKMTFSGCKNLVAINNTNAAIETNHLSDKITNIGGEAFKDCTGLGEIYLSDKTDFIGENAFLNWGSGETRQTIYIDKLEEEANWSLWTNGINFDKCEIVYTAASEFTVTFVVEQAGVLNPTGAATLTVLPNQTLSDIANIPVPTSINYKFTNTWYTSANRAGGEEFGWDTPIRSNLTLYAGWEVKTFNVLFPEHKLVEFFDAVTREKLSGQPLQFEYGWQINFTIEVKQGCENFNFMLGTTSASKNNDIYTLVVFCDGEIQITYDTLKYEIAYENLQGGTKGANNKKYYTVDDLPLQLDNPKWDEAYRNGSWEVPSVTYDNLHPITVTAVWSDPVVYKIQYENLQGGKRGENNVCTFTIEDLPLKLDNPSWLGVYKYGEWDVGILTELKNTTVTAKWVEPIEYYIEYQATSDIEFYFYPEDMAFWSERPTLTENRNQTWYTYESELVFNCVPGKTGYMGVWDREGIEYGTTEGHIYVTFTWVPIEYDVWFYYLDFNKLMDEKTYILDAELLPMEWFTAIYDVAFPIEIKEIDGYSFYRIAINFGNEGVPIEYYYYNDMPTGLSNLRDLLRHQVTIAFEYVPNTTGCVAEGTYITLADGSQKAVEDLTGNEMLLAWNLFTGAFDVAPILFIDKEPAREYEVIRLFFSDGTDVGVISEHGFWDFDLNKYVYLGKDAAQYIGHWFNKQIINPDGSMGWTKVQLVNVEIREEYTSAWSPVTYGHLCYYVNGMLSMPGGIDGLFNIFEVDSETLKYDEAAMQADIDKFGLFTYEEFSEILPVPVEMFEAVNGQYLKVAIGKGLITIEELQALVERYAGYFGI